MGAASATRRSPVGGLLAPLVSTLSRLRLAEELERLRGEDAVAVPALALLTRREHEIAGGDGSYPGWRVVDFDHGVVPDATASVADSAAGTHPPEPLVPSL